MKVCHCSLRIKNLNVKSILNDISFSVNHSEILALIGRNGAGKTTVLKAIITDTGYTGRIDFLDSNGKKILRPKIGYVPQKLIFDRNIPMTVLDLFCSNSRFPIWLGHTKKRKERAENLLKKVDSIRNLDTPIGNLSGGELQRILLAFALHPTPDVLLLDEPLSAVDTKGTDKLYNLIISMRKEYHMPIILVSHDLNHIYKYTNNYVLIEKKILEIGKTKDLYTSKKVQETFNFNCF
ncbi:MAG: metal ABC transporter ATP-binding protein [Candidatus Paraimprobicoccus trichonymphae]|uniref:Metal ABC transporter ATP-binding protein n=1 Tax=Candidatus Paraimprobicoccus trichonymphae TaxID=3033793 RepID=A0AA48I0B5_9FIRM|nr:MAG: metal ABC transporter ATP-binding protein [Candidatus Paraimprobicoccus trichonymphae]